MSFRETQEAPISFDQYIQQQRVEFESFCQPYFEKFQAAINDKKTHCDFYIRFETPAIRFPWSLVASELMLRYPQYEPRIVTRCYDPGDECELCIEGYTVRFLGTVEE